MHIDIGLAPNLSDEELIRFLHHSRCRLTDTTAEIELLRRFERSIQHQAVGEMAAEYSLSTGDIETLANAMHGDAEHTAELLGVLGEYALTQPQQLRGLLAAVHQLMQLAPERKKP